MKTIPIFVFLSLACCVAVAYSCASSSNSSKNIECSNDDSTNLEQHSSNGEAEALAAWNRFMNTFGYSHNASDSIEYPDYYGGAYVKDNKIIVFFKNGIDKVEAKKELSSRIDLGYVEFRECDYSYAELMNLDEWLFDFFTKDGNKSLLNSLGVDGWSINKDKNRILIKLRECSDFYVSEFKSKVINSPMISFMKSRGRLKEQATYKSMDTFGYSHNVSDSIVYPDYYGGSYIEDGKLIVYIVKGNNEKVPQLLKSDPVIVIKECEYSYNELLKATNEVSEFMVSEKNTENPIREKLSSCSLSETFNRVEVYVSDLSPSFISDFKKQVSNSPAIKFIIAPQYDDFENIVPTPIIIDDNL